MPALESLSSADVVVGCVSENNPKYLGQTLRLVQSIRWFGGELSKSRVLVCAVDQIDGRARRVLESFGAEVRIVPRFDARNGASNRLRLFDEAWDGSEQVLLSLDCDTLVVRDPIPLLQREVFQSKVAPLPTVTDEVFERLFARFDIEVPPRSSATGYTGTPTIPYFNAGVIAMTADVAERLAPPWRHYNAMFAADPSLVAPCAKHLHQAALALALAVSRVPVVKAGPELNYQLNNTHLPAPPGYADVDPTIIHYHHLVDCDGFLLSCPFPRAQERIDRFNERLREERSRRTHSRERANTTSTSPRQIPILGMHRSGTSLVARVVTAMGSYAGEDHELARPDVYNPTGYWERRDVWALNEEILAALDTSWLDPARADVRRLPEATRQAFVEKARGIVRSLDEHGSWMMKDPRLSILFPLWREVLDRPVCVLVWREPAAVAHSISERDGFPPELGLIVWEEYTRAMLESTMGLPRVLVSYRDLVADPIAAISRLHADLVAAGARDLRLPDRNEILSMVEPSLNHHGRDNGIPLNAAQSALRDALCSGAALRWDTVSPTLHDARELLSAFSRQWREKEALRAHALDRESAAKEFDLLLAAVFKSRSWRIGFAITRLWRRIVRSDERTALQRWKTLRASKSDAREP